MESILVVGAGLAGLGSVRAARDLGFEGSITVVGAEPYRPYDRPPLSKDYLAGQTSLTDIGLEGDSEQLGAGWQLGVAAVGLDATSRTVTLADGTTSTADGIVLATGSRARTLPGLAARNVITLRSVRDADRLRAELRPGAQVLVYGAGLIGSEVASTAARLGCAVTVVTKDELPLARLYGTEIAAHFVDWHRTNGVQVLRGVSVEGGAFVPAGTDRRLVSVGLSDGRELPADVVVLAVGGEPDLHWLQSSGLALGDGVLCDEHGATSAPGVVAVGDCAAWWDPQLRRHHRSQHWNEALERPSFAVADLLGREPVKRRPFLPYFWSDQYDHKIQMAGYASLADSVEIIDGDLADPAGGLVAVYRRASDTVAVLTVSRPRDFTRWRKTLTASLGHLPALRTTASAVAAPAVAGPSELTSTVGAPGAADRPIAVQEAM